MHNSNRAPSANPATTALCVFEDACGSRRCHRRSLNASRMPRQTKIMLESQCCRRAQNGVRASSPASEPPASATIKIRRNAGHLEQKPEDEHLQAGRAARGIGELRQEREEERQQLGIQQICEDPLPIHLGERERPGSRGLSGEPDDSACAETGDPDIDQITGTAILDDPKMRAAST
jgi:hypothetical protein